MIFHVTTLLFPMLDNNILDYNKESEYSHITDINTMHEKLGNPGCDK